MKRPFKDKKIKVTTKFHLVPRMSNDLEGVLVLVLVPVLVPVVQ